LGSYGPQQHLAASADFLSALSDKSLTAEDSAEIAKNIGL